MKISIFRKPFLPILALTIFGFLFLGYSIESSYYIPIVLNNANHSLYPTDLFVNSQSAYHSLFFLITGFLAQYIDLKIIFTILTFVTTIATGLFIFYLSLLLFKDTITAYLSVFLLLIPKMGMSVTFIGIHQCLFEPSIMVIPFSLLAIYLFLKERYRIACFIVGLMFYIHGIEAFSVAVMFLFYFIIRMRYLPRHRILQAILLLFLPLFFIAPRLFSQNLFDKISADMLKQWLAIMHFRAFWHLFPFSWGPGDYFNYFGWFLWAFIVLKFSHPSEKHNDIVIFCGAIAFLCFIGTIFVEMFPVPIILKLELWRSTMFFVLFLVIYISHYLINFPKENLVTKLLVAGTLSSIFFSMPRLIVCFAFLHLAFEFRKNKIFSYSLTTLGLGGILGFTLGSFLQLNSQAKLINKFFRFINLGAYNIIFFYIMFTFLVYFLNLAGTERIKFSKRALSLLILFFIFLVFLKVLSPKDVEEQNFRSDWVKTQVWAKENTSAKIVFITPPYLEGFRIHSQRGIVAENKDGGLGLFDVKFGLEWWQRMNDLGFNNLGTTVLNFVPECRYNYDNLNEKEVIKLGNKYGATYIVKEKASKLNFKLAYQNNHFNIYLINRN
ncbi:MAG: hypothetical protein Q8O13_06265 [Candidatus Omnitrophota bacterium]|nr:hypothetical protein [Candidatus Omnitrophota bacterium]